MNIKLNEKEAYEATFEFLDALYKTTRSDDLAILLGDMGTLEDNEPADPAFWGDWLECIQKAKNKDCIRDLTIYNFETASNIQTLPGGLDEKEAYEAMFELLVSLYERMQSDYLRELLSSMSSLKDEKSAERSIWEDWLECIQKAKEKKVDTRLSIGMSADKQF